MKHLLITLTSGETITFRQLSSFEEIEKEYPVGGQYIDETGKSLGTIAQIEYVLERKGSPTLIIKSNGLIDEQIMKEIEEVDQEITWNSEKKKLEMEPVKLSKNVYLYATDIDFEVTLIHFEVNYPDL